MYSYNLASYVKCKSHKRLLNTVTCKFYLRHNTFLFILWNKLRAFFFIHKKKIKNIFFLTPRGRINVVLAKTRNIIKENIEIIYDTYLISPIAQLNMDHSYRQRQSNHLVYNENYYPTWIFTTQTICPKT